ncbi:MAG: integrase arm-type DNA-binding domain-containing protein [Thermodesulfobacteriota bacterium]
MPMTDVKVRNAKPKNKQFKLFDTEGLFLLVTPAGGKWWRFKYRLEGKEKLLSLGTYPEVGLSQARVRRDAARKQVADGIDPSQVRKALKAAKVQDENTFEVVAREWHDKFTSSWTQVHAAITLKRLELNVFPWIGARPIIDIKAQDLLRVLRRIESRGAIETAHRVRIICGQVFRYAVATGRAERDPVADLRGALPPVKSKHFSAMTEPEKVGGLLRAIDGYEGALVTKCALRLAPLLFVRPGELRQAEWAEIDLDAAEWNIPAEKMKTRQPHLVPLARQAVEILRDLYPLTGAGRYVFPSPRTPKRPMSNNAVLSALRRMGFEKDEMTGHGFRAMARTILDEVLQVRPELIEHQLAHAVRDPLGRAYNRTKHLPERRRMMQTWADYLDGLKSGAKVIPIRRQTEQ